MGMARSRSQAGAQSVSQPPTPGAGPLSVILKHRAGSVRESVRYMTKEIRTLTFFEDRMLGIRTVPPLLSPNSASTVPPRPTPEQKPSNTEFGRRLCLSHFKFHHHHRL